MTLQDILDSKTSSTHWLPRVGFFSDSERAHRAGVDHAKFTLPNLVPAEES